MESKEQSNSEMESLQKHDQTLLPQQLHSPSTNSANETSLNSTDSDHDAKQQPSTSSTSTSAPNTSTDTDTNTNTNTDTTTIITTTTAPEYYQLIEDLSSTNRLPTSFVQLVRNLYRHQIIEPAEMLIALVYYLFFEMGFAPSTLPASIKSQIRTHWSYSFVAQIPEHSVNVAAEQIIQQFEQHKSPEQLPSTSKVVLNQRPEQIYRFNVNLLNLSDHQLLLIIRKSSDGKSLCISFCSDQGLESTSIYLIVNDFILCRACGTVSTDAFTNCDIDHMLNNPSNYFHSTFRLSKMIKDNLILPIRTILMDNDSYPSAALSCLPKEILWSIFKCFRHDLATLQQISRTCVYLRFSATRFLEESNIRLRTRRPTRIVHENDNRLNRHRRFHLQIAYPRPGEMFYSRRILH